MRIILGLYVAAMCMLQNCTSVSNPDKCSSVLQLLKAVLNRSLFQSEIRLVTSSCSKDEDHSALLQFLNWTGSKRIGLVPKSHCYGETYAQAS